jgi:hypothetical protein
MYRSKPLAVIRPYHAETDAKHLQDTEYEGAEKRTLTKLPDPQTVSIKEKTAQAHPYADSSTKPLDKLGMRRALV